MSTVSKKIIPLITFTLTAFCLIGCGPGKKAAQIPLKDFFRSPESVVFDLSPDGTRLSYLAAYKGRLNIFIRDIGSKASPVRLTEVEDRDIEFQTFSRNDTVLYLKDSGGDENFHLFAVDIKTRKVKDLTPFKGVKADVVDDLKHLGGDEVLITMNQKKRELFDVYRVNIKTGKLAMIAANPGTVTGWIADHEGKVRAAVADEKTKTSIMTRETERDAFKTIISVDFKDAVYPLFYTFDNKNLYAISNLKRDKSALVIIDAVTGEEKKLIYENPDADITFANFSRKRKTITAVWYVTDRIRFHFIDPAAEKIYKSVKSKIGDNELYGLGKTDIKEERYILKTYSDRNAGSYFLHTPAGDSLEKLGDAMPWLPSGELCEMKPVQYKARDGLLIHGYLTIPKGARAENLPLIVNPHGGPWYRDAWHYNAEVQFLANRGYAVFQCNFRGSISYGKKFWTAGFKQWGRAMQDDITDGVLWLIKEKIADPKRVAIYGGSYGGYAALAGLAFTPDLYACGIDYVGISNLFTHLKSIPPYWTLWNEQMYEMIGHPEKDKELLMSVSPFFHADKIKAPLLVAQGKNDPRVNKNESDQIVGALKKRNIDVIYIVKDNEGHGFANEENRIEFYDAMEKFLAKHLNKK